MVKWTSRSVKLWWSSSDQVPWESWSPPICLPVVLMSSKSVLSSISSCHSRRRTTSTESAVLVVSEEREQPSTSFCPVTLASLRRSRITTTRKSMRCQLISMNCELGEPRASPRGWRVNAPDLLKLLHVDCNPVEWPDETECIDWILSSILEIGFELATDTWPDYVFMHSNNSLRLRRGKKATLMRHYTTYTTNERNLLLPTESNWCNQFAALWREDTIACIVKQLLTQREEEID